MLPSLLIAFAVLTQTPDPSTSRLTFEVASFRPSGPNSVRGWNGGPGTSDPENYTFGRASLLDLIPIAYNIKRFQVSSKHSLETERFDIAAKVPPGTTKPQFQMMLRNLLEDRLHLKLHTESKEFPAYELQVSKAGSKLQPVSPQSAPPDQKPEMQIEFSLSGNVEVVHMKAQLEPISVLAQQLDDFSQQPVTDGTHLTGTYTFQLDFTNELPNAQPGNAADVTAPSGLFSALPRQLGLQLVPKKLPFDVFVIDSVDKVPTAN